MDHNKCSEFIILPIISPLTEIFHCLFLSVSLVLQATNFPVLPCQRGQGKFSSWLPSPCVILRGVIPHWTEICTQTGPCVHLKPPRCVRITHDLHRNLMGVWWNKGKKVKCEMCLLLDKRQQQQHFSAARRRRQVLADQPRAQECDFSYEGWAEL